jgi:rhodanese-related sulfurtransferase
MKVSSLSMAAVTVFLLITGLMHAEDAVATKKAQPAKKAAETKRATAKNVTPDEVEKLLSLDPKPIVLDVRTPEEFASGHIPGATNIDSGDPDFAKKVAALEAEKRPVIVHCAAGGRSARMLPTVTAQKFPAVYHMNKGFSAWSAAGKPVEKK